MDSRTRRRVGFLAALILVVLQIWLAGINFYYWFLSPVPLLLGGIASWMFQPKTVGEAAAMGTVAGACAALAWMPAAFIWFVDAAAHGTSTSFVGWCIAIGLYVIYQMINIAIFLLPALPTGALGGWLVYSRASKQPEQAATTD